MKRKQENQERVADRKGQKKRNPFRFLGWGSFFPMLAEAGAGILLLALPENSLEVLSISVGVLFCVLGVFLLATAFLLAKAGILRLAAGAVFIGVAVWLFIARQEAVTVLLYILLGILFLRAFLGMWNALVQNKGGSGGHWWQIQFTVCLVVLLGAFILFFPLLGFAARCIVTGVLFAVDAAAELCSGLARLFSPKLPGTGKEEKQKESASASSTPPEEKGAREKKRKKRRCAQDPSSMPSKPSESSEPSEPGVSVSEEIAQEERKARRFPFGRKKKDS